MCRLVARRARGGSQNRKTENCFAPTSCGGPNLEKVNKIYTCGEQFSKKGNFDYNFGILPSWGGQGPLLAPPRYGPGCQHSTVCIARPDFAKCKNTASKDIHMSFTHIS